MTSLPEIPGLEQRSATIKALAEQSNVPLSEKVIRHLSESQHEPDSRRIKELLVRFQGYASLMNVKLTTEITDELFWGDSEFCDRLGKS